MKLLRSITGGVLIEGHRGAEGLAVENTWEAIIAGFHAGADLLELDIQQSSDGELVIYHSYQLPDGHWLRQLTSEDLQKVRVKGHSIAFLKDVFEWVQGKSIGLSLDVKNGYGFDIKIFQNILKLIEIYNLTEQVMIVGWDHTGLLWIKNHNPHVATRALIRGRPVNIVQLARNAKVNAINLDSDMVTEMEVNALHEAGIAVVVAEMFSPDYLRPTKLGADVICCKNPKEARAKIERIDKSMWLKE